MHGDYIRDMSVDDLTKRLIGQVIIAVDSVEKTLTLSNGSILTFEDTSSCCAWFEAELIKGNLTDNAITDVVYEDRPEDDLGSKENYTIHILASDKNICDLNIVGDAASGHYCLSINLDITTP